MISPTTFCTVANPQLSCSPIAGVAKPTTAATLRVFENVQRNLNRVLYQQKQPLISVDGRIGPGTMAAVAFVQRATPLNLPYDTVDAVALNADFIMASVDQLARSIGAPASVPDPAPTSPPSRLTTAGNVAHPPDAAIRGGLGMTSPLVLAAAGVAVLLLLRRGKPRRRRR